MHLEWPENQKGRNVNTDKKYYDNIRNFSFQFFSRYLAFTKICKNCEARETFSP